MAALGGSRGCGGPRGDRGRRARRKQQLCREGDRPDKERERARREREGGRGREGEALGKTRGAVEVRVYGSGTAQWGGRDDETRRDETRERETKSFRDGCEDHAPPIERALRRWRSTHTHTHARTHAHTHTHRHTQSHTLAHAPLRRRGVKTEAALKFSGQRPFCSSSPPPPAGRRPAPLQCGVPGKGCWLAIIALSAQRTSEEARLGTTTML